MSVALDVTGRCNTLTGVTGSVPSRSILRRGGVRFWEATGEEQPTQNKSGRNERRVPFNEPNPGQERRRAIRSVRLFAF